MRVLLNLRASDSRAIIVQTATEPWSYAASFKLSLPDELKDEATERLRVVVDLQVESGLVGVGCLNADLTSYVDRELELPAGSRRKVYVPTGERGSAASLMIRNASTKGECSRVRIYGIESSLGQARGREARETPAHDVAETVPLV